MRILEMVIFPLIQVKIWIHVMDDAFVITKKAENAHNLIHDIFEGIKLPK